MNANPDFPLWLQATHLINFVLIGMLFRSGWEILSSLPRLWWSNDCPRQGVAALHETQTPQGRGRLHVPHG